MKREDMNTMILVLQYVPHQCQWVIHHYIMIMHPNGPCLDVYQAFVSISDQLNAKISLWVITPQKAFIHAHHDIRNLKYLTADTSQHDSTIFFKDPRNDTLI